jgi:CubicO group peptidase (beta-lactamase class C family)
MRRKPTLFLAVVLSLTASVFAQSDKTDDFIKAEMKRQRIPGLSLAIVKEGKIIKAAGYGVANIPQRTSVKPETVFKIASVSKQFIATGVLLLVQDGRIGLDDRVSKYLEGTPATWEATTIRHLLTHTAGLVREAPAFDGLKVQSDADVIQSAYSSPLLSKPGDKWEYSNTGYFALAEVIRKVSGRPWDEYLSEKVFRPSGMTTTWVTTTKENVPNRAVGYQDNDRLLEGPEWSALRPSGAFLSTVLDLAKWDAVLYTDGVLNDSMRGQMWTPVRLNDGTSSPYGFGWFVNTLRGRKAVYHTGGMLGFRAAFARFPDDRLSVIVVMNLDDVDIETIWRGLANLYLPSTP